MRRVLAETGKVRTGELVRISLRLRKDCDLGRITIWSRQDGDEFSPYVNEGQIEASNVLDRPLFLQPMEFRLTERRRHVTEEFRSEVEQFFRVVQEIDGHNDPKVNARIKNYGKASEAFGRFCRNAIRKLGGLPAALVRKGH